MSSLKDHILREAARTSYAELFLSYLEKYHPEVFVELQHLLERKWQKVATELSKRYPLSSLAAQEAQVKNPSAKLNLEVFGAPQKLVTPRPNEARLVSPSVGLPLAYPAETRTVFLRSLLDGAQEVLHDLASTWQGVFHHEKRGQLVPSFKILRDHDEVKLQLITGPDNYKTIYAVRVEPGRIGSKRRDFDRVYLTSLI